MKHTNYHKVYDTGFFERADGYANWQAGQLRCGDALCAFAYAFGIPSYERVREIVGFEDDRGVMQDRGAWNQIGSVLWHKERNPTSVLDIGGGRGELGMAFAVSNVSVQVVEPHIDAYSWVKKTAAKLFNTEGVAVLFNPKVGVAVGNKFINLPCPECLDELDLSDLDTVTMVESLEHIPEDCFAPVWEKVKEALVRNKGRLIVANWIQYHPLGISGEEHCRLVDDSTYDWLAEGGKVAYRNGSHLVVDYAK